MPAREAAERFSPTVDMGGRDNNGTEASLTRVTLNT
jgi:hypothetical protein